jgi:acyl-CoA thioesterase FadM
MRLACTTRTVAVCVCMNCDTSISVPNEALQLLQQIEGV